MLWFDGSIRNAVDIVKSSGVILLVFVQGDDRLSKKYESFLNEETKFNTQDYVAIKISSDSLELHQFKQIYVSVPIPSIFLIENSGIPIKIISSDEISDFNNAMSYAVEKQKSIIKQHKQVESNGDVYSQSCAKVVEEVSSKAKQHVRKIGRKFFNISEEEIKKRLNEIRSFPRFLYLGNHTSVSCSPFPESIPRLQSARIQFRLPNNDMPSWEFPYLSTLGDVRAYLMEKIKLSSNFKLMRTYPRTAFTRQDEFRTLAELSLTPNATLIVVPVQDKTVQAKMKDLIIHQSFISTVLNKLLQPVFIVLNYIKKHILRIQDTNDTAPRRLVSETSVDRILNKKTSTSNIHSFKFEDDTDSETEHPDNGNSTQQRFPK